MAEPTRDTSKEQLKSSFKALAGTYDQLRFLQLCAQRLVELTPIAVGQRVLDVATGTGVAAFAAAERVSVTGSVVGVDLSPDMLAEARRKIEDSGMPLEFREADAQYLDFPDNTFDVVLCASSLFFIPDMLAAVSEWRRVLVPGGHVAFSTFGPTFLQPLRGIWEARLQRYGLPAAALPTHRLADGNACKELLRAAGYVDVHVYSEQLGYDVATARDRWADITAGIEGKPLLMLPEDKRAKVQEEHLAELSALATEAGIWVDVPGLFALARKAGSS